LWEELATDWMCIDCELMPWSVKAMDLIRAQYAAVGASGVEMLSRLQELVKTASGHGRAFPEIEAATEERLRAVERYRAAYAAYCKEVTDISDIRLAPFHLLATEGKVHANRDHAWHMGTLARLAGALPDLVLGTPHRAVDLADPDACEAAFQWWADLTSRGGEGMVVKPFDFIARGSKGLLQPAVKCRGPEYLRIIYGPEYTRPANLERLRERGLSAKRALALKEFALGIESLTRFIERRPLRQVHECVFGVLALETDPVDPRL
jgi:protein phosphatase